MASEMVISYGLTLSPEIFLLAFATNLHILEHSTTYSLRDIHCNVLETAMSHHLSLPLGRFVLHIATEIPIERHSMIDFLRDFRCIMHGMAMFEGRKRCSRHMFSCYHLASVH
ncbi:unnamed protein product [Cercospora beticola]|nr:unnamed protein product [Cercospora beticola]